MSEKNDRLYSKQHEWAIFNDDGTCLVGISDYAQSELGNIVFANLPEVGDSVAADTPFCDVESIKTVSDVYSPVTGKVISVNEEVIDNPTLINTDPYGSWFAVIGDITAKGELLSAEEYDEYIKTLK